MGMKLLLTKTAFVIETFIYNHYSGEPLATAAHMYEGMRRCTAGLLALNRGLLLEGEEVWKYDVWNA